jgi:hypothetical protein
MVLWLWDRFCDGHCGRETGFVLGIVAVRQVLLCVLWLLGFVMVLWL